MGNKDNARQVRKQAERLLEEVVNPNLNARLDSIDKYCRDNLAEQNNRARAIQGWLVQEVKTVIQGMIEDNSITILALVDVLAEANLTEELLAKVEAKKPEVKARLQKQAVERMEQQRQANQDKAASPAETVAPEPSTQS